MRDCVIQRTIEPASSQYVTGHPTLLSHMRLLYKLCVLFQCHRVGGLRHRKDALSASILLSTHICVYTYICIVKGSAECRAMRRREEMVQTGEEGRGKLKRQSRQQKQT